MTAARRLGRLMQRYRISSVYLMTSTCAVQVEHEDGTIVTVALEPLPPPTTDAACAWCGKAYKSIRGRKTCSSACSSAMRSVFARRHRETKDTNIKGGV